MPDDDSHGTDGGGVEESDPTRICPHCATVSSTSGEYCPHCGKALLKRSRLSRRARIGALAVVAILALAGAAVGLALKSSHDETVARHQREARTAAAVAASKRHAAEVEAADEKATAAKVEVSERQSLEHGLEEAVTKDARKRVNEGSLEGPIVKTSCIPVTGGSSRDMSASTGTFTCIAVTKIEPGGEESGDRFSATVDFAKGEYSWHLGG